MMTDFDRIMCDFPLPEPRDQDREFHTADFGGSRMIGMSSRGMGA